MVNSLFNHERNVEGAFGDEVQIAANTEARHALYEDPRDDPSYKYQVSPFEHAKDPL